MSQCPAYYVREMQIGIDKPTTIRLKKPLPRTEANLLHILGEFPNRLVPRTILRERLQISDDSVKIRASRLRRKLTADWVLNAQHGGYRLIDLRGR